MNYQKQQVLMNIMDMGGPDGKLWLGAKKE